MLPALGGALAHVRLGGFDLLRPWDGTANVRRSASYPLVPWSNRIGNARFTLQGEELRVQRNFGDSPHALHGVGWQRPWQVLEHTPTLCVMSLRHEADAHWPFSFEARQQVRVDAHGLHLELSVSNGSDRSMPTGLGWHPYFPRHGGVQLQFAAAEVWQRGADELPSHATTVPPEWDFRGLRAVEAPGLDHCFAGWQGQAQLHWPEAGVGLRLSANAELGHLVVFTPEQADFIAVEPVSHLNDAINRDGAHGLVWLEPGQAVSVRFHLRPEGASPCMNP